MVPEWIAPGGGQQVHQGTIIVERPSAIFSGILPKKKMTFKEFILGEETEEEKEYKRQQKLLKEQRKQQQEALKAQFYQ